MRNQRAGAGAANLESAEIDPGFLEFIKIMV